MKDRLLRYSLQLSFLRQLIVHGQITEKEYEMIKNVLMKDYNIRSDLTAKSECLVYNKHKNGNADKEAYYEKRS